MPVYFRDQAVRHTFPVFPLEYHSQLRLCLFAALRPLGQVEQVDASIVRGRHHCVQLLLRVGRVERGPRGQADVRHAQAALSQVSVPEPRGEAGRLRGRRAGRGRSRLFGRDRLQFGAQLFRGAAQIGHAVQAGYRRLASTKKPMCKQGYICYNSWRV